MKVVDSGFKIDLHIHSVYSKGKDKEKVKYNTVDNLDILTERLDNNGVQICAITDHDCFNYDLYCKLKENEIKDNSIIKVLPGIEFSVAFNDENDTKDIVVHVIAIFNDEDKEKIKNIGKAVLNAKGEIDYDCHVAFSEKKFLDILRKIDLDTILIAHQKNSPLSKKPRKSDANSVGEDKFQEFIYTDYFEAFEFKNKKNEVFNKMYIFSNQIEDSMRFITGSDCHDWRFYPKETENDNEQFTYSYVKCLPTFRGLVMAITDYKRIKTVNSFFNPIEYYIPKVELFINEEEKEIPLSKGINVIIGDNSIGKSLFLHKLTGYIKKRDKLLKPNVAKGYDSYLKQNKIFLTTEISEENLFAFDMQGEVRRKFEEGLIKCDDFFRSYYPEAIKAEAYRVIVEKELEKIYRYLEEKFQIDSLKSKMGKFEIIDQEDSQNVESLSFVGSIKKDIKSINEYEKLLEEIKTIIEKIKALLENKLLSEDDKTYFNNVIQKSNRMVKKYDDMKNEINSENEKIGVYQEVCRIFKQTYQSTTTDRQKNISAYIEMKNVAVDKIVELIQRKSSNDPGLIQISTQKIQGRTNTVFEYEFNSRLEITEISIEYIYELLKYPLKKGSKFDIEDITVDKLANFLPYYEESPNNALDEYKKRIKEKLDDDFKSKFTITQKGMDKTQELSAGFNAQIYFDLLSYENDNRGIYIIDQPEDNISQNAIKGYLLDRFKIMGEHRQVIIVTHNPQFIVNLDVDNVVYLGKKDGKFEIYSGALEYKNQSYDMLELIAEHIEGGLDTLKRRWKRYEKNSRI